ncbi:GNAT family N-acetyltransferase [Merdimmobilis hominis]|uniref:GNAT family N-acetyltransferase n=1 Tax=Merdimmobilis hominis TaxID=2897707 RepID=UPI0008F9349D|nr:GNAT family N-acetyltransferase [Merdimmobilis hominis]PWL62741.1 MAG: N-acetyltransferase [Oscillospiraceae bacterium]
MEICAATKGDLEGVRLLYRELFCRMALLEPAYFQPTDQNQEFLEKILEHDLSALLVAKEGEEVLGLVLLTEMHTAPYDCLVPHTYGYLMDLVVESSQRGQGIGTQLIRAARRWSEKRGHAYLELGVLNSNLRAAELYEREGFSPVMTTMRLPLGQN